MTVRIVIFAIAFSVSLPFQVFPQSGQYVDFEQGVNSAIDKYARFAIDWNEIAIPYGERNQLGYLEIDAGSSGFLTLPSEYHDAVQKIMDMVKDLDQYRQYSGADVYELAAGAFLYAHMQPSFSSDSFSLGSFPLEDTFQLDDFPLGSFPSDALPPGTFQPDDSPLDPSVLRYRCFWPCCPSIK